MADEALMIEALETREKRRAERRYFFRTMAGAGAAATALSTIATPAFAQTAPTEVDVLNFALNLEYLEAQFYTFAVTGAGLPASLLDGSGTRGEATGGRRVNFTDPVVAQYATEIAQDERAHVEFLRLVIGGSRVAQPTIDIGTAPNGAFSQAALASGLITAGQSFDPYANDENFLLGAFIFEDVGVTAYKGAAPLINSKDFLEGAAGLLAVEAYHAGLVRTTLYRKGIQTPSLVDATEMISNARDSLDGTTDLDQGIRMSNGSSNIFPSDGDGLAFSRSAGQVLNIVYLTRMATTRGGFFPAGVNGNIRTSAAN